MKRGKKLLVLLLVLVLVTGAAYAATLWQPEQKEETVYTSIFTIDPETVTQITWDYKEELTFCKKNGAWVYDADPSFPVDETYIETMLSSIENISSSKTIENVENWDQYTLEAPICEIVITAGEKSDTIKIGEETSIGGERYLSIGDGNAYLVDASLLDAFSYGLYDVLSLEKIPSMTDIYSLRLESKTNQYEILKLQNSGYSYSDDYIWFMEEKALDTELTQSLVSNVKYLTWTECVNYHADDLSKYGLDDPAATVTVSYLETVKVQTGKTDENGDPIYETEERDAAFVFELGNAKDNQRYARIPGSSMVYTINGTFADTLMNTTYYELQPDEVLLMDWENVRSMEITLDGETYQVVKSIKTVTDDEGNESEDTVWLCNGEEVDAAEITEALDEMDTTGYANGQTPERDEEVRIRIHRDRASYSEVELVFYRYDSSQCLTTLNGVSTVFVDREQVVDLVDRIEKLVS